MIGPGARAVRPLVLVALAAVTTLSCAPHAFGVQKLGVVTPTKCLTRAELDRLSNAQLAMMTLVDPIDEGAVASVAPEVASGIGGIILLGSDATPALGAELRTLLQHAPPGRSPFVMVDEEGGAVQRLLPVIGAMPAARTMGATMTPRAIRALAVRFGRRMRALGITMDLAPVVDLDAGAGPSATNADGTRSFSVHASVTTPDSLAFADGLLAAGVVPVLKHFPGLGGATGNTDLERAATVAYRGLKSPALQPFVAGVAAGMPAVMISNAEVPGLTSLPASLSRYVVTGVLRHQMGFSGLVISDSLSALSIVQSGFSLKSAAVDAIVAGADEILFNAAGPTLARENSLLVAAMVDAIASGVLQRSRLLSAARDQERAKVLVGVC